MQVSYEKFLIKKKTFFKKHTFCYLYLEVWKTIFVLNSYFKYESKIELMHSRKKKKNLNKYILK